MGREKRDEDDPIPMGGPVSEENVRPQEPSDDPDGDGEEYEGDAEEEEEEEDEEEEDEED